MKERSSEGNCFHPNIKFREIVPFGINCLRGRLITGEFRRIIQNVGMSRGEEICNALVAPGHDEGLIPHRVRNQPSFFHEEINRFYFRNTYQWTPALPAELDEKRIG